MAQKEDTMKNHNPPILQMAMLLAAILVLAACAPASTNPVAQPTNAAPTSGAIVGPQTATAVSPSPIPTQPVPANAPTAAATDDSTFNSVTLPLGPGRDGVQPGTVTFVEQNGKTQVTIEMQDSQPGVAQPAHIHVGSCPGVGAVKYPLSNVVDGKSVTTVDATLADLFRNGYSVNVHKSTSEAGKFVACLDLKSPH